MSSFCPPDLDQALFSAEGSVKTSPPPCLPAVFLSDHLEAAWLAILGSPNAIKQLAQKLMAARPQVHLSSKALKRLTPAATLSAIYASPDYITGLHDRKGIKGATELALISQLPRLLEDLLPAEELKRYAATADLPLKEAMATFKEAFPDALRLVALGLPSRYYPMLLALPPLVKDFTEANILFDRFLSQDDANPAIYLKRPAGVKYTRLNLALHIILCDLFIDGLPELAIAIWPGLREAFAYAIVLSTQRQRARHPGRTPLTPSLCALQSNLNEVVVELLPDLGTSPFVAFNRLHEMSEVATLIYHQLVSEQLAAIFVPTLVPGTRRLNELAQLIGMIDELPAVECWEPAALAFPERITPEIRELCLELDALSLTDDTKIEWNRLNAAISSQHKEIACQRKRIHELSAEGANTNIQLLAKTAEHLASLVPSAKENWLAMHTIILNLQALNAGFVDRWAAHCEQAASPIDACHEKVEKAPEEDCNDNIENPTQHELLEGYKTFAHDLERELDEVTADNHRLREKLTSLQAIGQATYTANCPEIPVELTRKIVRDASKCSPREVLEYIQALAGDKVIVLPSAWKSADDSARFEYTDRLLALLDTLVFEYAPALASGTPDTEARKLFGNGYSSRESVPTRTNTELRRERTFIYEGEQRYFERHLRIGNCPGAERGMRLYFDIIDGVVVIAYCGQHLSVAKTN